MKVESREFEPGVPFSAQDARDAGSEEQEVARMLEQLLIAPASNSPRTAPPPTRTPREAAGAGAGTARTRVGRRGETRAGQAWGG